ncbi:MAG TPA: energy transducer TonB, partial [Gemmatimonadaceae bacterium]
NAPHPVRPIVSSLAPPPTARSSGRPVAALGRFWYPRPPLWPAAISAMLHVAIGTALVWTAGKAIERSVVQMESARFIAPPQQQSQALRGGGASRSLALVSLSYFSGAGSGEGAVGKSVRTVRHGGELNPTHKDEGVVNKPDTTSALGDNVYSSFEVDNAVQISSGSAVPQYPPDLLARRVQGKVVVRFVVDTSGSADVGSIQILDSSDPQFAASVREALPRMKFSPARLNGRRVRQLVEQPFRFNVTLPSPSQIDSTNAADSAT